MNLEEIRTYCIGKKGVTESFPFGEFTLVFKVGGKMFALLNLENPHSVNLKCDPEKAVILREQYPAVLPGYHMNKKYWNTVLLDGSIPAGLIREWIDHSWDEVVKSLPLYRQKDLWNK